MNDNERTFIVGYCLGVLAREANQNGNIKVSYENVEKMTALYGVSLNNKDKSLIEYMDSLSFITNLQVGENRQSRRKNLKNNVRLYK